MSRRKEKLISPDAAIRGNCISKIAVAIATMGLGCQVLAFEVPTDNSDVSVRWDNTFKYSAVYRLNNPSSKIVNGDPMAPALSFLNPGPLLDDGDRNFKKGIVSNRLDWFSEFDAKYKNVGVRLTGSAWYDDIYNQSNDNTSAATINSTSVPAGQFTHATRDLMGQHSEILDAFVYLKSGSEDETPYNVRLGKHTLLYGETLFFGANGIAGAQAPIDFIKLLAVPGSQFKEIIRPVGQVSGQVQVSPTFAVGAYYQYEWQPSRLPASGSFLSDADFVGDGSEKLLSMAKASDLKAKNSGQGGVQLRFRPGGGDVEYGVYAARYHDKGPNIVMDNVNHKFRYVYAENVNTYGASFSTVAGDANIAGEVSIRTNAPLVSAPQIDIGLLGNGSNNPLYAVGRTAHANISMINVMNKTSFWDGASFLAELAFNRTLSIEKNPLSLDVNATRDAWAFRMILEPQYFQIVPGVDLTVPIGLGYNPSGRSSAVFKFNGGVEKGGDFSVGLKADFNKKVTAGINYVHFFGPENAFLTPNTKGGHALYMLTNAQSLHDRDFISFQIQTSF